MQIVIEIPEEQYNALCMKGVFVLESQLPSFLKVLRNGTPLPKGHGGLVDVDKLYAIVSHYSDNEGAVDGNKGDDENYLIHKDSILEIIETRETVIPADKEDDAE